MSLQFLDICQLFEQLSSLRDLESRELSVQQWFEQHQSHIRRRGPPALALLSCLFPEKRADRVYALRTQQLEHMATASACLSRSITTFERYQQKSEKRRNIDPRRPLQLQEYQNRTLYTTCDISYTRLERDDPDAARLLKLLAYFNPQSLWYELFQEGVADDTPLWLRNDSWSTHTCVHDWTLVPLNTGIDPQHYWYAFSSVAHPSPRMIGTL